MKLFNKIAFIALGVLAMTACTEKEADYTTIPDPDIDFTFNVDGDEYSLDYYVVSTIKFNNRSAKTGSFTWDFGDGETSTEASPTHKYDKAGQYNVKLSLDGVGFKEMPIMIVDITPQLTVATQSTEIIEINDTKVSFNIALPNPENLRVRYEWTFPEGTTDAAGNALTSFTGYAESDGTVQYPGEVSFKNIGSQRIEIKTFFDIDGENRRLEDSYLNVQVGSNIAAPTLYYAVKDGNIKAIKIIDENLLPKGTKIMPYDMGVKSGTNPFNLCYGEQNETDADGVDYKQGYIYIVDAGKQYTYINDEDGVLGDGMITAMRTDGTGVNTVITNVGGFAFNDPFQGSIYDGQLYYSDCNTGVSSVEITKRGAVQGSKDKVRDSYFIQNNTIPYYNRGIAYGAISCGLERTSDGTWWWGKNYSGNGIYRFANKDIYATADEALKAESPFPIVCSGISKRSFTIDEQRGKLYIWRYGLNEGLNVYALPSATTKLGMNDQLQTIAMFADPVNSTDSEGVYTSQLALDKETGRVFFGFRPVSNDDSNLGQGIVYYDPNDTKCHRYGEVAAPIYGVAINPNKTKLF